MLVKSWMSYRKHIKSNPIKALNRSRGVLQTVLLAATFLVCEATAAAAVSFSNQRSVEAVGETPFQTSVDLQINDAANIYVVDGINNTLEVFDTSIWFLPLAMTQSNLPSASSELAEVSGKVYFLDGINNTLQVLDTRSGFVPEVQKSSEAAASQNNAQNKTYLIDDFNQSFQLTPDNPGVTSTSGRRNGLITPPTLDSENFYIADGFNNTLQIAAPGNSSDLGDLGNIETSAIALLSNFFNGPSGPEDIELADLLPQIASIASGELLPDDLSEQEAQAVYSAISQGPFAAEDLSTEEIIDSIGNPERQLGWIKSLMAEGNLAEGTESFSLKRDVDTGNWKVGSAIQVTADDSEDVYIVDGFNSRLQVTHTSEGTLFTDSGSGKSSTGNFYLVDGINNTVEVSDASKELQALFSGGEPGRGLGQPLELSSLMRSLNLTAQGDEDYFQLNGINNAIELFNQAGERISLEGYDAAKLGSGIAMDGQGNVYVLNGINNRVRGLTNQTIPEKNSLLGLLLCLGLLYRLKVTRTAS